MNFLDKFRYSFDNLNELSKLNKTRPNNYQVQAEVENEVEKLALLSPNARVNIIRNYAVADKKNVEIPKLISDIVHCPNENCICNNERGATSSFNLNDETSIQIQCTYCGRKIDENNIDFL